jgi:hypothetical protein
MVIFQSQGFFDAALSPNRKHKIVPTYIVHLFYSFQQTSSIALLWSFSASSTRSGFNFHTLRLRLSRLRLIGSTTLAQLGSVA